MMTGSANKRTSAKKSSPQIIALVCISALSACDLVIFNDQKIPPVASAPGTALTENHSPIAFAQSLSVGDDSALSIVLSASDQDSDSLSYVLVTSPLHGLLTGTAPNLVYTPSAPYSGSDSFTFKTNDGTVDSANAAVSITVTHINHLPVATAQSVTVRYNTATAITLLGADADGGDTLTYSVNPGGNAALTAHGTLSVSGSSVTYTPTSGYVGADSFTFIVNDGSADSGAAIVSLTVAPLTFCIRTSGDNLINGCQSTPFLTAQAAVDAAIAANPSSENPIVIDVGSGSFGNVTLTQDFGQYVSWRGVGTSASIIGNITASGADDDGNGNAQNGHNLVLNTDGNVLMGNLYANAGYGDAGGNGANGGSVHLVGDAGLIFANGGNDEWGNNGGTGGSVVVSGGHTGFIAASGGAGFGGSGGGYCWGGGSGGDISISASSVVGSLWTISAGCAGVGGTISVLNSTSGDINVFGSDGDGGGDSPGGAAGTVIVSGSTVGKINAYGGSDIAWGGGAGGMVTVGTSTSSDINANGGNGAAFNFGSPWILHGGPGGIITLNTGANTGTLTASGGAGLEGHGDPANGGAGGTITIHLPSIYIGTPAVDGGISANGGASGSAGSWSAN